MAATREIRAGLIGFGTIGTGVVKLLQRHRAAIDAGKSIVTANKALIAVHGPEILAAAAKRRVDIGLEASVGGGIPIVRVLRDSLVADRVRGVYGIVNGTCNHILSTMTADGRQFTEALAEAQARGLAEADPSFDIDGIDSAHKLVILTALAFGAELRLRDVFTAGIRGIDQMDVLYARELGCVIKLLAIATYDGESVAARVHPALVPTSHVLAGVSGAFNAIYLDGEALGSSMYYGLGAGMMPTATAVVADLVEVARNRLSGTSARVRPLGFAAMHRIPIVPMGDLRTAYYLRIMARDTPGVLGDIAGVLGRHEISIGTVIQKGRSAATFVPIVIRTHEARESNLHAALTAIRRLKAVKGAPIFLRIEENLA
jgi:homoserine dehydrogenase